MSEDVNIEKALVKIIEMATEGAELTGRFVADQAPDAIQQLLRWHYVESLCYFSVGVVMAIVCVILSFKSYRIYNAERQKPYMEREDGPLIALCVIMGLLLVFTPGIICSNLDWLQISISPKVWLIEYAKEIIK